MTSLRSIRARSQRLEIHGTPAFAPAGDGGGGQEKFVVGATMRGAGRESRLARVARTRTRAAPGEREPLRTRTRLSRRAQGRGRSGCGHRPPKVAKAGTRTRCHAAASAAQTAETCGVQARVEPAGAPYLHCLPRHDRDRCGVLDGHWPHGVARHVTRPLDTGTVASLLPIAAGRTRPAMVRATRRHTRDVALLMVPLSAARNAARRRFPS